MRTNSEIIAPQLVLCFSLCAVLFALCFSAEAQQQPLKPARICWLSAGGGADHSALDAFRDGMRDLGYVEGRNLVIDARWGDGSNQRLNRYAVELVSSM